MGVFLQWLGLQQRSGEPLPQPPLGAGVQPPQRPAFTTDTALGLVGVYRAVSILATAASQLTLDAWRGEDVLDPKPALIRRPDPNPKVSLSAVLQETVTSMATTGDAYWKVTRNARNEAVSIQVLDPLLCNPTEDGKLGWPGRKTPLAPDEFAHLKLLRLPGRVHGLGPIQAARVELTGARDLRDYGSEFFTSGDVPSGVLKSDQVLTSEQAARYKEQWHDRQAHEVAVLGSGLDYRPVLLSPKDAQFVEVRQFTTTELARLFGIPAHMMLAAVEGTSLTYSNMSQADLAFVRWTVSQYTREIEEAFTLLLPGIQTARFNFEGLLRSDTTTRYEAHSIATGGKPWALPSEVRAIEHMPPMPGIDTPKESA